MPDSSNMYANSAHPDLEKEYTCSLHTRRFQDSAAPNEKIQENFLEVSTAETERVSKKYNVLKNMRYGGEDDNQLVDIYYKNKDHDNPIFVFIHGGYWQNLDRSTAGVVVEPLVERNFRVVVMDYNLCPKVTMDQLAQQTRDFFKWLYIYAAETKASSISFCGHSAGAHLLSLLFTPEFIKIPNAYLTSSFFLISGVYDLRELWKTEAVNPNGLLSLNAENAKKLSTICWNYDKSFVDFCNQHEIRFHVIVGEVESQTFIGQAQKFSDILQNSGLTADFKIMENYDHFDILEDTAQADSAISRYILDRL